MLPLRRRRLVLAVPVAAATAAVATAAAAGSLWWSTGGFAVGYAAAVADRALAPGTGRHRAGTRA